MLTVLELLNKIQKLKDEGAIDNKTTVLADGFNLDLDRIEVTPDGELELTM